MKKRKRLDKEHSQIVVIGSGLAGLSAAISLEQAGFLNISIYERDENFDIQKEGYGLTLTYNPKGPLASLGVLEQVAQKDCPSRCHYLFRPDGSILGFFGCSSTFQRGRGQRGNLRVPRKVLRRILFQKLSTTNVHWDHRLVNFSWGSENNQYRIELQKSDGKLKIVFADLLVSADGIRSAVLQKVYRSPTKAQKEKNADELSKAIANFGLRYLGVRLILGISNLSHPLLQERGFYTLDGKHRLFTMPYQSSRFEKQKNRIMWQLSFALDDQDRPLDSSSLRDYVLKTCASWHTPVLDMIHSTPLETIWGTDLMDRDPRQVWGLVQNSRFKRIVVLGDALHSMSPFKGQGANQSLADGPLLASWLQRASIDSAVTGFWREAVQRTAPVVEASRQAARELHSPKILQNHGFAGIKTEETVRFLSTLQERKVTANLGAKLDGRVAETISDLRVANEEVAQPISPKYQARALELAASGDTQGLRQLCLSKHVESIRTAKNEQSQNCLHLAAQGGHQETCKWLIAEVDCDSRLLDENLKTPIDYAMENMHESVVVVFGLLEKEIVA